MKHSFRKENGIGIFELQGKLMGESDDLKLINEIEKFAEDGVVNIIMDFTNVQWTNSRGVGICMAARDTLVGKDGDLRIAGMCEKVLSIFRLTHIDTIIKSYNTLDEAVLSFKD